MTPTDAAVAFERHIQAQSSEGLLELSYPDRKRVHNLKYYTWVEQQGKTYKEILAQWNKDAYWEDIPSALDNIDSLISEFNARVAGK